MKNKGFSLIELIVVIAIIALLAVYALPNYRQYVVRSKRVEAQNKVLEVAGMYEKFYANTNAYPTDVKGGGTALSLTNAYLRWDDYVIRHQNFNGNGWRIRAFARGQQKTDDPSCQQIRFDNLGRKTPAECWE